MGLTNHGRGRTFSLNQKVKVGELKCYQQMKGFDKKGKRICKLEVEVKRSSSSIAILKSEISSLKKVVRKQQEVKSQFKKDVIKTSNNRTRLLLMSLFSLIKLWYNA